MLPGVHRVRRSLADDRVAVHWYAWRGGPSIMDVRAHRSAVGAEVARAMPEAARRYQEAHEARRTPSTGFLAGMVHAYLASPEFDRLAVRTKKDLRKHLDVVRSTLGDMPVRALEAKGARPALLQWRERWRETPRTADHHMAALAMLISWARDRGLTTADPLQRWPRLYRVDRSEIIWTPEDLEVLLKHAKADLKRAVLLAAYSGLRLGDMLRLTWGAVGEHGITLTTAKRKRLAVIPITPELRKVLNACPRRGVLVLTGPRGGALPEVTLMRWFRDARTKAAEKSPDIAGKRWHDLRGTFATHLARSGFSVDEIARIMGWSRDTAEEIITRYVSGQSVALAALHRLDKNRT